ncbi:hypothetical protein RND81_14G027100 [Saponaria officinalis]|uniref:Urease accessory protein UreH-like transmembrane domain-containing protein n=1 Tax=Saponaria officinalis TaxID=3572 RepID=A0AAW1GRS7_SAPOF
MLFKFNSKIRQFFQAMGVGNLLMLSGFVILAVNPALQLPVFVNITNIVCTIVKGFLCSEALSSAMTGFFASWLHTLCGPDHLAALAPLSIGCSRVESAVVGAIWGCGHDAGQLIFGVVFLLLKDWLHIDIIQIWGTRMVGFTLLIIGVMGITLKKLDSETKGSAVVGKKKRIGFATFVTGIVHGLQPDALLMILPALASPSMLDGAAFLGMFLVGTVVSMAAYTLFIASCSEALKDRVPSITEKLTLVSSIFAVGFGFGIIICPFFGFSLY